MQKLRILRLIDFIAYRIVLTIFLFRNYSLHPVDGFV